MEDLTKLQQKRKNIHNKPDINSINRRVFQSTHSFFKHTFVALIMLLYIASFIYDTFYMGTNLLFSKFYFLPILLIGLWYSKAVVVAMATVFGAMIIVNDLVVGYQNLSEDLVLVLSFLFISYVVGVLKEQGQDSEKVLEHHANHDLLTGLPNRLMFENYLQNVLAECKCGGHNTCIPIFLVDIDKFKYINDIMGHMAGDNLLVMVSNRLKENLPEGSIIARSGGDEFLITVPGLAEEREYIEIANRIIHTFKERFVVHDRDVYLTVNVGISVFPQHGEDTKSLISNADIAMYKAKEAGKNSYNFFSTEMNKDISDRLNIANQLRQIVEEKNYDVFVLHYQPLVESETKKINGVEALLRWNHPEQGLIYPGKFMRVAEETGLIVPIGKWVLRTACLQVKKWQESNFPNLRLSVNISEQQLRDKNFFTDVVKILEETEFDPLFLELEITETIAMNNSERNIHILDELRSIGVKIALDDFGSGYSSLNYLGTLPINILKVDYDLVREIPFNLKNSAIATSIISLAACLNYEVVAEGVENEAQLEFFRQQKCKYIQGYLFSKPLPADELESLLHRSLPATIG